MKSQRRRLIRSSEDYHFPDFITRLQQRVTLMCARSVGYQEYLAKFVSEENPIFHIDDQKDIKVEHFRRFASVEKRGSRSETTSKYPQQQQLYPSLDNVQKEFQREL